MTVSVGLTEDIAAAHAIRRAVFVEEQGIDEAEDIDGLDDVALHILARDNGTPIGTARILFDDETGKIGRVSVLRERRGTGLGQLLVRSAVEVIRDRGARRAILGSQTHAVGFYEALDFKVEGPEFMDAGIPHRLMVMEL